MNFTVTHDEPVPSKAYVEQTSVVATAPPIVNEGATLLIDTATIATTIAVLTAPPKMKPIVPKKTLLTRCLGRA